MPVPRTKSPTVQTYADLGQLATALGDQRTVATIGVFDGMHLGHQALISNAVSIAKERGLKSLVITFAEHPLATLAPPYCPKRLLYTDRKHKLLERMGVDYLAEIAFTPHFASWEPAAFIEQVLVRQCRVAAIVCGYDFTFGQAGSGNIATLQQHGALQGYDVTVVSAVAKQDVFVKSTQIRDLLFSGNVEHAAELLSRPYELRGEVVTGFQRGRTIGFPTANLQVNTAHVVPGMGVYFCGACVHSPGADRHAAMVNIGHNPTFGVDKLSIEAHLLQFEGELVGRTLELHFLHRLREERKFSGIHALTEQLHRDKETSAQLMAGPAYLTWSTR